MGQQMNFQTSRSRKNISTHLTSVQILDRESSRESSCVCLSLWAAFTKLHVRFKSLHSFESYPTLSTLKIIIFKSFFKKKSYLYLFGHFCSKILIAGGRVGHGGRQAPRRFNFQLTELNMATKSFLLERLLAIWA